MTEVSDTGEATGIVLTRRRLELSSGCDGSNDRIGRRHRGTDEEGTTDIQGNNNGSEGSGKYMWVNARSDEE